MSDSQPRAKYRLLVVDSEPSIVALFEHIFGNSDIEILVATSGAEAIDCVQAGLPEAVVMDVLLPDADGLAVFRQIKLLDPQLSVVVMTGVRDSQTAIQAMQLGALDYLLKPLDVRSLNKVIRQAIEVRRMIVETVELAPANPSSSDSEFLSSPMIGCCDAMQEVYKAIGRVASQNISVLIRGESGTGKELVARAIFQNGSRRDRPFLAINCAAIPEALLESELFGHERGSFTGADRKRIGKIEQCNHGTLFLDEIGDMDAALQSKLLRVLQEKQFERVGGDEALTADVRILAATHRNIEQLCVDGKFREDLFYRLNGYSIHLPPLRERGDDIELLIDYFRTTANREMGKETISVAPEAIRILRRYDWPGNIRQLQNVIHQAVLQSFGTVVQPDFLPPLEVPGKGFENGSSTVGSGNQFAGATNGNGKAARSSELDNTVLDETVSQVVYRHLSRGSATVYDDVIEEVERKLLAEMLMQCDGNQTEAARRLGITRTTVRTKVHKLGIGIRRIVE